MAKEDRSLGEGGPKSWRRRTEDGQGTGPDQFAGGDPSGGGGGLGEAAGGVAAYMPTIAMEFESAYFENIVFSCGTFLFLLFEIVECGMRFQTLQGS